MSIKKSRLLPFIICLMSAVLLLMPFCASAETSAAVSVSGDAVAVGNEFAVTVGFTADDTIGTVQAAISYNESYLEFVSGDGAFGGGGIVNISDFPDTETSSMTLTLTFRAVKSGSSSLNLTNGTVISPDGLSLASSLSASADVTITDVASSGSYIDSGSESSYTDSTGSTDTAGNSSITDSETTDAAQLKSLTVGEGVLQPAFSPGIYDYTVTVGHEVNRFEVEGETADPNDTIWYAGSFYLADGKNQQTVTVTSADGTVSNVYIINIYRESENESSAAESDGTSESDSYFDGTDTSESSVYADTGSTVSSRSAAVISNSSSGKSGSEDLRDKLMPAMYVAAGVLVLAVAILIVWIKNKSKNKLK